MDPKLGVTIGACLGHLHFPSLQVILNQKITALVLGNMGIMCQKPWRVQWNSPIIILCFLLPLFTSVFEWRCAASSCLQSVVCSIFRNDTFKGQSSPNCNGDALTCQARDYYRPCLKWSKTKPALDIFPPPSIELSLDRQLNTYLWLSQVGKLVYLYFKKMDSLECPHS